MILRRAGNPACCICIPETLMAKMTRDRARDFTELARRRWLDLSIGTIAGFRGIYFIDGSPSTTCRPRRHVLSRWRRYRHHRWHQSQRPKSVINKAASPNIPTPRNIKARRGRRGPAPGAVDRYRDADRALFPEIRRIMRREGKSLYAAALKLAEMDKVKGAGTATSRAKRIVKRFNAERSTPNTR